MPGRKKQKVEGPKWQERLDTQEVAEALEEATVDTYGGYEQHTGLLTALENELVFPFAALVLGERASVVGMEWPDKDELGLDLVCERKGKQYRVAAASVELVEPLPVGHLYLAAYLKWKR